MLGSLIPKGQGEGITTRTLAVPAIPGGVVAVKEWSSTGLTVAATDRDVITRWLRSVADVVSATATNTPLPQVTPTHPWPVADWLVQLIPSGLVITRFSEPPSCATATKRPLP